MKIFHACGACVICGAVKWIQVYTDGTRSEPRHSCEHH